MGPAQWGGEDGALPGAGHAVAQTVLEPSPAGPGGRDVMLWTAAAGSRAEDGAALCRLSSISEIGSRTVSFNPRACLLGPSWPPSPGL